MAMTYTKVKTTTPQEVQLNAGILLSAFNVQNGSYQDEDILAATTGGIQFSATPSYIDWGDDIDNAPKNVKEFKEVDDIEVTASFTSLTLTADFAAFLSGAADVSTYTPETPTQNDYSVQKVTPRKVLKDSDYQDVWIVGDYGRGGTGYVAIHILNTLSTGGLSLQTTDKGKGQMAATLTGHYSIDAQDVVPYEVYIGTAPVGA